MILDAATAPRSCSLTDDGDSWAHLVAGRRPGRIPPRRPGQVVDLRMVQLEGSAPAWTVGKTMDLTTSAGLDSVSRPDWFVPADAAPGADRGTRSVTGRVSRSLVTAPYLERLAARTAATRHGPVRGRGPRSRRPAGRASRPTLQGVEAFARLILEASLPYAAAVKPNLAFFEAHGSAGRGRARAAARAGPRRRPVRRGREAGRHRHRPRPGRPWRCTTSLARTPSP